VPCTLKLAVGWGIAATSVEQPGSCSRCPFYKGCLIAPLGPELVVRLALVVAGGVTNYIIKFVVQQLIWLMLFCVGFLLPLQKQATAVCHCGEDQECGPLAERVEAQGMLFVPILYCSWILEFTAKSFI